VDYASLHIATKTKPCYRQLNSALGEYNILAIKIKIVENGYNAKVTPPHGNNSYWESTAPMTADQIIEQLLKLGCHQTDIGDALYEAEGKSINIKHPLYKVNHNETK